MHGNIKRLWVTNIPNDITHIFLLVILMAHGDLGDLYRSFRAAEVRLELDKRMLRVRGVIRAEWMRQLPEIAPFPMTESLRTRAHDFLMQTVGILERMP